MPKTGRNIYKRKDGRWEGRYVKKQNINGKISYGSIYGKTCAEVKQRLSALLTEKPSSAPPRSRSASILRTNKTVF